MAAEAKVSDAEAQVAALTLMIEKLRRALYGRRSERKERLLDQLELALDELTAERDRGRADGREGCGREHRGQAGSSAASRRASPSPSICRANAWWCRGLRPARAAGRSRLSKIGEDVTETLEVIPRRWKVIQTVREKFTCRDCEKDLPAACTVPRDTARLGGA